jgi:hypothetical protein
MESKVLNIIKDIKKNIISLNGYISYDFINDKTCLESWIILLNNPLYNDIFKYIQISQKDYFVLIKYRRYSDVYGGESEVNYDKFWNLHGGFYRECRSIVIDIFNEEIVILPFDKFFNINENNETSIENINKRIKNAKSIEFSNKIDGSMQCARYYKHQIIMSGSQAINPENSWRLADGMKMLNDDYIKVIKQYSDFTFIFEYISLADAHVVIYTKEQEGLYLIGLRNTITGEHLSYKDVINIANKYNIKTTEVFNKTLDNIMSELDSKKSNEMEGFVMNCDGFFTKIKYNHYLTIHNVLSTISSINLIIKTIADDKFDDLLCEIPLAYKWRAIKISNFVLNYIKETEYKTIEYYNIIKNMALKDAMIYINTNIPQKYKGFVIQMYKGNKINYIKNSSGRYTKLKEMGINEENYADLFKND